MSSTAEFERREEKGEGQGAPQTAAPSGRTYVKAMPLHDLADVDLIKNEVGIGNVVIAKITPLARKSVEDVGRAVNELCEYVKTVGGDIARLGEERIVVTPSSIRIWREKATPSAGSEAKEEMR